MQKSGFNHNPPSPLFYILRPNLSAYFTPYWKLCNFHHSANYKDMFPEKIVSLHTIRAKALRKKHNSIIKKLSIYLNTGLIS